MCRCLFSVARLDVLRDTVSTVPTLEARLVTMYIEMQIKCIMVSHKLVT